jgi:hypothetical protein
LPRYFLIRYSALRGKDFAVWLWERILHRWSHLELYPRSGKRFSYRKTKIADLDYPATFMD